MNTTTTPNQDYFATMPADRLAREMQVKIRLWRQYCNERGFVSLWKKKLNNYYGMSEGGNSSQSVTSGGSEGELSLIKINDLHNLVQNQLTMVTSQHHGASFRSRSCFL